MISNFESAKKYISFKRAHKEESLCGAGSWKAQAGDARDFIQGAINKYRFETILDLGCGDWNWMQEVDFKGAQYLGIDCDDQMIQDNSSKYGSDQIRFQVGDIFSIDLPKVDLVICRDVLFHVRKELSLSLIQKLKTRDRLFFLSTSFNQQTTNQELRQYCKIEDWGFYRINLLRDPFNLQEKLIDHKEEKRIPGRSVCLFYL
jgi:2-polyprenyl-3-methyl-5-hydroxy-6-metoxy-1,4-benzoquinol methylase